MTTEEQKSLSRSLYYNKPYKEDGLPAFTQWQACCTGIASAIQTKDFSFDRGQFLKECGWEDI